MMINGAFGNGYKGAQSALEVSLVLGFPSVTLGQCLKPVVWGAGLNNANYLELGHIWQASPVAQRVKRLHAMRETWVRFLGWEVPLEKEMATHSSILAWRIPWMEEPGGLQSMGSQRVGHD